MRKFRLSFLALVLCLSCAFCMACTGKSSDGNKSYSVSAGEKEKYLEKAQTMKNALSEDKLTEVYTQLKANGGFEKFLEGEMTKVEQSGKPFTVVVQQAKYAKNTLTYTISFDKDDKLAGIFYK